MAIAVGLRTAAGGTVSGIEETSVRALAKLEQVLPARLRERVLALSAMTVPASKSGSTVDSVVLTLLATACRHSVRLRMDYRSQAGDVSTRTVEPHRIVHTGRRWYLIAWNRERADWRHFRVDRIRPWTPTGPRFVPPRAARRGAGPLHRRSGDHRSGHPVRGRFRFHASAAEVANVVTPSAGLVEPIDEHSCQVTMGSANLDAMVAWLGVLGFDFDFLDPPKLTPHLHALAARLIRGAGREPRDEWSVYG